MPTQYSRRMVAIHWLTLLLAIATFYLGHELDEMKPDDAKMALYPWHFWLGDAIFYLTLVRLYLMRKDGKPAPLPGSALATKVSTGLQHLLYLLLIAVPVSGIVMKATSGLTGAVDAKDISKLPDLETFAIHEVHATLIAVLLAAVALHAAAALYHQFLLKDNIMQRMSLRR
jgi:cytochrome b561